MDSTDDIIPNQVHDREVASEVSCIAMSKNQLKRQKRQEMYHIAKKLKKEQKKAGKSLSIPDKEAVHQESFNDNIENIEVKDISARKLERTNKFLNMCSANFHVVLDCQWESEHTDSSLKSLTQQIMFCYGHNRSHQRPAIIHISNLGSRATENLKKLKYENWVGVTTSANDYTFNDLYSIEREPNKKQLVYLTSDGDETLTTLRPDEAYIIGGIVDRNRLKGITYQKAKQQGIRTARLPIKEYFSLSATHVLTVNHVFEILLAFSVCENWAETLQQVLPKRKEAKVNCEKSEEVEATESKLEDEGSPTNNVSEINISI